MQLTLVAYSAATVWLGAFLLGESGMLAAFALAAQGHLAVGTAIIWAFLGSLSADIFWYLIIEKVIKKRDKTYFQKKSDTEIQMLLIRLADRHTFLVLTFIKFLVGMRLLLTIYIVLMKHIPFKTYLLLNTIGTVFFIAVLFPLGWFLGKGLSSALSFEHGFIGIISVVALVLILFHIAQRLIVLAFSRAGKKG